MSYHKSLKRLTITCCDELPQLAEYSFSCSLLYLLSICYQFVMWVLGVLLEQSQDDALSPFCMWEAAIIRVEQW